MSNKELDNYRALYDEFRLLMIEHHNHHCDFINNISPANSSRLRRVLKKLRAVEYSMYRCTGPVINENRINIAERLQHKRDIKKGKLK